MFGLKLPFKEPETILVKGQSEGLDMLKRLTSLPPTSENLIHCNEPRGGVGGSNSSPSHYLSVFCLPAMIELRERKGRH